MELFRGDTFFQTFETEDYKLRVGDKLHIAVMRNAYSKKFLFEKEIEIKEESESFDVEILPSETKDFPIAELLLEIELTTVDGIVQTNQYKINVEVDGING